VNPKDLSDLLSPETLRRQIAATEEHVKAEHRHNAGAIRERLRGEPGNPTLYIELARQLSALNDYSAVLEVLREGVRNCPSEEVYRALVDTLAECNLTDEAIRVAQDGIARFPNSYLLRLPEALLLPLVYDSTAQIDRCRDRYAAGLERLHDEFDADIPSQRESALKGIARHINFQLGCQGRDDRALQERYGEFVSRVMQVDQTERARPRPRVSRPAKLRIGYFAAHFHHNSLASTHLSWLEEHNRTDFELFAYYVGDETDHVTEQTRRATDHFYHRPRDVTAVRRQALADHLDVAVFLDVGTHPAMTLLAAERLAQVQCASWGYPTTTGLSSIDYYLSSDLMEPPDGDAHYCERLVRLPGIGVCVRRPSVPRALLKPNRQDIGLGADRVVYLCCQQPHKYLPEHDDLFPQIAIAVPNAQFVFLSRNAYVTRSLMDRFERAFSQRGLSASDYCVFLGERGLFEYWALNLASDIFLDSLEWSGCNTTLEAIDCGLPIVTLPGRFMRGRHSYAILTQLGVPDTIAADKRDYVRIAARLGVDRDWRQTIVETMGAQRDRLFSDTRSVVALEQFFRDVTRR
jgi:protein O-GlcNAc transferase